MRKLLLFIFFLMAWGSSCWAQDASYKVQNKETAPGVNERRGYGNNVIYLTFGGCNWTAGNEYIQHNTGKNSATVTDSYKAGQQGNNLVAIDGFVAYIAGNCNPKDELGYNWGFGPAADGTEVPYEQSATTRLRRFNIPCRGAFFKFEPMADGTLSVYLFQNGCINQQKIENSNPARYELNKYNFSYRPIYILDEAGEAVTLDEMQTTAKVRYSASEMPNGVEKTTLDDGSFGYKNPMEPIYFSWVIDYWRTHGRNTTCDFLKLNSNDKAEVVNFEAGVTKAEDIFLLDCGITKYTFKVKAGKTYFVFAQRSKSGLAGFQFWKTSNGGGTVQMTEGNTYSAPTNKSDVTVELKNRSLKADVWQPICLPFSVSEQQVKTIFGDGTEIAHFDNTANDRLTLKKHIYHSIIAGVPCFIKSKQAFNGDITFPHVTIEKDVPEVVGESWAPEVQQYGGERDYQLLGTFGNTTMALGDYFISAKDGQTTFYKVTSAEGKSLKAFRSWISPVGGSAGAKELGNFFTDDMAENEARLMEEYATGISSARGQADSPRTDGIYNMAGQRMSSSTLPSGIYIVNGKKMVIK